MCKKLPLVLWSGGFDSTCLVIDLLHLNDIDILYVTLGNNDVQQRREKIAINKLKCLITDANLEYNIRNEYTFGYGTLPVTKTIFAQPSLWIHAATFIAAPDIHSKVVIGYVKNDDIWHYKHELNETYNLMNVLTCHDTEPVPLEFPYEWVTKNGIRNDLKANFIYYKQIMNCVSYCESGDKDYCGECSSCKRHAEEINYE